MTISGFLPRRWRTSAEIARHTEAVAGVLHTAPLDTSGDGPVVISLVGTTDVLPYLVAIKSLRRQLGRARMTLIDDGTLTGEDRTILAYHCGDPEIIPHHAVRRDPFPPGGAWALLLTILDRRAGRYWIALDPHTVTLGPLPEVGTGLASNRSFGADFAGLAGFAAGGGGREIAAHLVDDEPTTAEETAASILAREPHPIELPRQRYAAWHGKPLREDAALVHFPAGHRFAGDKYVAASLAAIAGLVSI
jgi:hypothetical protein